MRWKQFFTPVQSINASQGKQFISERSLDSITILDVRQRSEYEKEHLPGAKWIPLPELDVKVDELDVNKDIIVYCAVGGRSRVAAQMLIKKGFKNVLNLSGGIKGWNSEIASGSVDQGLELFSGNETVSEMLILAYSLEAGLFDFYTSMSLKVNTPEAKELFNLLSGIEIKHQERIYNEYRRLTGDMDSQKNFEKNIAIQAVEGGYTTQEYVNLFKPNCESPTEIIEIAMSIEAQALDLYQRASEKTANKACKNVLSQIAAEERLHLTQLGKVLEKVPDGGNSH